MPPQILHLWSAPPPADFQQRWQAFYAAVMRQESAFSRFGRRLVTPRDQRAFKSFLRTHWDPVLTPVTTTGISIRVSRAFSLQQEMLEYVRKLIAMFWRARSEAEANRIPVGDLLPVDESWIALVYPQS